MDQLLLECKERLLYGADLEHWQDWHVEVRKEAADSQLVDTDR